MMQDSKTSRLFSKRKEQPPSRSSDALPSPNRHNLAVWLVQQL
jgi:hypothetical protein